MGGPQAAGVLSQITRDAKEKKGQKVMQTYLSIIEEQRFKSI